MKDMYKLLALAVIVLAQGLPVVQAQTGLCYSVPNTSQRYETGGFLWKPHSEVTGALVVLFPSSSPATKSTLYAGGQVIQGTYVGRHNGDRPHFRYPSPGAAYPNGSTVCATGGTPPPPPPPPEPETKDITPAVNLLLDDE